MLRRVMVENGLVEGLPAADPRITSFKGIPFAAPPVGTNRWRAPQPAKDWEGVLYAYKFAPISMQHIPGEDPEIIYTREWNVDTSIEMDEDSLHLNVWTPAKKADEKLPVFVWYFGGGLQEGNTAEMEFDGERIARRGIVVVTINYRLNAFGFLCHPEITAENPDAPANFGFLDQQCGTRWVKRNIAAFGGDPDNITIGGQSAGGGSVMAQVTSPTNKGLFQKAIVDSGLAMTAYPGNLFHKEKNLIEAEQAGVEFFKFIGVSTLQEARKLDTVSLRDKMVEYKSFWGPVIDDKFYVGDANERFMANRCELVPMMFGHTATEFPDRPLVKTVDEFVAFAREAYGSDADEFLNLCKSDTGSISEMLYRATVSHLEYSIRLIGKAKKRTGDKTPIYYWVFNAGIPGWDNPGAFHSVDLWFFFETLAKCWRPFVGMHYDLARKMCNYWANFIRTGDPNGKDADGSDMPFWKPFTEEDPNRICFYDEVCVDNRGPDELMKFLMRQYLKKHKQC
ncbi:MAG: carboxylesterase family protein [Desulfatiglans sp.]|jgi:para-nitrobenzyl esterase|nr:carboxylesterase family protein [Desulfatiglans sp.]